MNKNGSPRHVRLYHSTLDAPAFLGLSSHATRLLLLLLRRWTGFNNGAMECSVRHAAEWLHTGKDTALKAFQELQACKLIAPERKGHFEVKAGELKNIGTTWRLLFVVEKRP